MSRSSDIHTLTADDRNQTTPQSHQLIPFVLSETEQHVVFEALMMARDYEKGWVKKASNPKMRQIYQGYLAAYEAGINRLHQAFFGSAKE
jgi:hypothetical protein